MTSVLADDDYSLDGHMEILMDPSRRLGLSDVLRRSAAFRPISSHGVNIGSTRAAAWLRIAIESKEAASLLLSLTPNFIDFIDVYVATLRPNLIAGDFKHYAMGDHRPLPRDDISAIENIVPLDLAPDETKLVYVRIVSVNSVLNISAELYPAKDHVLRTALTCLAYGMWFGGMAILFVIQIVFWYFDRRNFYIILAVSTLGAMLVYFVNLGLSRLLLFPDGGRSNDLFQGSVAWLGLSVSALMTASILDLQRHSRVLLHVFRAGALVGVIGVGFVVSNRNLDFAPFGNLVIIALSTLAMVQSLRTMNENGLGTRLPAAAFTLLWVGLVATVAQRSGVYPLPNWVSQGLGLSSLLYTLLLTGALGVRLREAETLNRTVNERALALAQAAEQRSNEIVAEKTRELAEAKKLAEDALHAELQSKAQQVRFMEVISHQYRTPLAAIRTNVDGIDLSLSADDYANRDRLHRVRRGIMRLVDVLEVNLTRSRLQGPSFRPNIVPVSLNDIVTGAGGRARDLLQGSRVQVEVASHAAAIRIMADAGMLEIAIINLLENAVKFSNRITVPTVTLSCAVEHDKAVIAVRDEGIGIPAADLDKVMNRFVRASNATHIEGTGLGLSLVQRIAAAHNGHVVIESVEGAGTTVEIVLPILAH